MDKEELEYLHSQIDRAISRTWKYMLTYYCIERNKEIYTDGLCMQINHVYSRLLHGYRELDAEYVNKYYEENKERLYEKAIQSVCSEAYFYEKYTGHLTFTDKIPYPLPKEFDFSKVDRLALISYFQNKRAANKEFGTILTVMALDNLPEELAVRMIGVSITASQIMRRRQLLPYM